MSPQPTKTTVIKSFADLDPDMFATGEPSATSTDGQVIDMTTRLPRVKSEIEDEGGYPESPESTDTEPEAEATDAASINDAAEEPQSPRRRILIKDLCQALVAAGIDPDENAALLRIREWYKLNVEGGADKVIVLATQARKELRDAVATWIAAGTTGTMSAGDEADVSESTSASDEPLTVEAAKLRLMEFITMAREYGEVQELADEIYTIGMELGVPEERLFQVGKGEKAYSPTRARLEAEPALIKKTWYYGVAYWMSQEERTPQEFLEDWYWPGTKPKPVRSREPRSQEPSLPQPPAESASSPASTPSATDTPPADAAAPEEPVAEEALDPARQFKIHRTGEILTRLDDESDEDWTNRTKAAVKAARKAKRSSPDQPSGDAAPAPKGSPFSTESADAPQAPVKSVSSLPGGGTRIVRTDGTTEDKPYDWSREESQRMDEPEGSDTSASQPTDAASMSDEPVGDAADAVDDLDDELARITRDAEFMFDQGFDPEAVFAALLD